MAGFADSREPFEHVTLVRSTTEDPCNGHEPGHEWFEYGAHHEGVSYDVRGDDGNILTVESEAVIVVDLGEPLAAKEALERTVDQLNEIRNLGDGAERGGASDGE